MISFRKIVVFGFIISAALIVIATIMTLSHKESVDSLLADYDEKIIAKRAALEDLMLLILHQHSLIHRAYEGPEIVQNEFIEYGFLINKKFGELSGKFINTEELEAITALHDSYLEFENLAFELYRDRFASETKKKEHELITIGKVNMLVVNLMDILEIVLDQSKEEISEVRDNFDKAIIIRIIIQFIAFSIAISFLLITVQFFLKPNRRMVKALKAVTLGDLSQQLNFTANKELHTISESFNTMVATLKKHDEEIIALNESLEQKIADRTIELEKSRQYLHNILFNSPVSISIFDPEGILVDCNDSFLGLLPESERETARSNMNFHEHSFFSSVNFDEMNEKINLDQFYRSNAFDVELESGTGWYIHNIFANKDPENNLTGYVCFSEDVTEQTSSKEKIKDKNKELESFVYTVSHDLKAPMYSLAGMVKLFQLEMEGKIEDKVADLLARINRNLKHMEQMVNDLLQLSRAGTNPERFEAFNPEEMINLVVLEEKVARDARDIDLKVNITDPMVGDKSLMPQLFRNLISNSIKYRDKSRQLHISITCQRKEHNYQISYKDNGVGIDEQNLPKVFDVFYRSENNHIDGSGVGLTIVKKIVEGHGGTISISSEKGMGTEFIIKIPQQ